MEDSKDTIIICDDHDFRGRSVAMVIKNSSICATCLYIDTSSTSPQAELRELAKGRSGVILAVIVLGSAPIDDPQSVAAVANLRAVIPSARIALLCDDTSAAAVEFAVAHGLDGIVPTYLLERVATAALRFILAGGFYFPHTKLCNRSGQPTASYRELPSDIDAIEVPVSDSYPAATATAREPKAVPGLTQRQSDVLESLCRGCSNKVIARELDISEATVKIHVRQLLRKFDASSRTQIVVRAAGLSPETVPAQ